MNKRIFITSVILLLSGIGINIANAAAIAPTITTEPVNVTVIAPAKASFTIKAAGSATLSYQWMQSVGGGAFTNISGATKASYTTAATTGANNGTQFECVVSNSAGSVISNVVTLTVNVKPAISAQPVSVTVTQPAAATFSLTASGTPAPAYQWQEEVSGATVFSNIPGATGASYTTPATALSDSKTKYRCVVTNTAGTVTSSAVVLTVYVLPSITTQPLNVTVKAPAKATFKITASATPAPSYQWLQSTDGITFTNITGATKASYTTAATTYSENGTIYECTVSNAAGSTTSNTAVLTVNPHQVPVVSITSPASGTISAGNSLTITATASETGGTIASVSFYNGTTLLATSTSYPYTYTIPIVTVGNYSLTAKATDTNNASAVSAPVLVSATGQPAVAITSPANNSTMTTGAISITAVASENYGTINNVAFYNGTTLLGTVTSTSQAYTYSWSNVAPGVYTISAIATDILGNSAASAPITFTINQAVSSLAVDDDLATTTDPLGHTTSYQYDNDHRLLKTIFADGSTVSFAYDLFGNQLSVTDQRGNTLKKTYDAYERLIQTTDPLGGITQFSYDTNGDLLALTDANDHSTSYTYDGDYRVLTQNNALGLTTTYTYDPAGNVLTRTDANGNTTNYTYDALNRLTNTAYPDGTSIINAYDALGRKTTMTDATGQTSYNYDALSRLLSKTSPGTNNTIAYTYDSEDNRLTSVDQNNRTITNTYDALNRLASVTDPNGTTNYAYDAVSNEAAVHLPNGVTESFTYDALNRVLTDTNASSAGVLSSFSNVYDIAGMITKKTYQDGSWTAYSYDALNRLLEETNQTSTSIVYDYVYTYDPVGNRLTWTKNTTLGGFWNVDSLNLPAQVLTNVTNGGYGNTANPTQATTLARSYSYDAANRLTGWNYNVNIYSTSFPIQSDTYTYDNNGNRLTKQVTLTGVTNPEQTNYGYDFENRLTSLNYTNIPNITGTQTDALTYNGEGLRTGAVLNSVASNYSYDGFNILVERDGSGNTTKSYTRGLDLGGGIGSLIDQNIPGTTPVTQFYDYNDLGSTADLTTTAGTAANSYAYDAFGNLLAPQTVSDTNRYLFSTKEFDSRSGLEYFGARYYDPEIGRWLTPDPIGFRGGQINLYAYVGNNPVNEVDPYGLFGLFEDAPPSLGLPGFGGESGGGLNLPGFTPPEGPLSLPGVPDEFGPLQLPGFSGGNDCGGKENAQDCGIGNNGDVFSDNGSGNGGDSSSSFNGHDFENDGRGGGEVLPNEDEDGNEITYTTYDASPTESGENRGQERIVVGSDGSVYYTDDHYQTFKKLN